MGCSRSAHLKTPEKSFKNLLLRVRFCKIFLAKTGIFSPLVSHAVDQLAVGCWQTWLMFHWVTKRFRTLPWFGHSCSELSSPIQRSHVFKTSEKELLAAMLLNGFLGDTLGKQISLRKFHLGVFKADPLCHAVGSHRLILCGCCPAKPSWCKSSTVSGYCFLWQNTSQ